MGENSRWNVDTITNTNRPVSSFDVPIRTILLGSQYRHKRWGDLVFYNVEAGEIADFIIELVHEIKRLQTENIRLEDEAKMWRYKYGYVTTKPPFMSPPQPFYMEPE